MRKKQVKQRSLKTDSVDELIREFYQVKNQLRVIPKGAKGESGERRILTQRKDELLLKIKTELRKIGKERADKIKTKLREDLGVII